MTRLMRLAVVGTALLVGGCNGADRRTHERGSSADTRAQYREYLLRELELIELQHVYVTASPHLKEATARVSELRVASHRRAAIVLDELRRSCEERRSALSALYQREFWRIRMLDAQIAFIRSETALLSAGGEGGDE